MRISTNTLYALGTASLQNQTLALIKTQQQIASGRRMQSPEDDPVGAAYVLDLKQIDAVNTQYQQNIAYARNALSLQETVLGSIGQVLQNARVVAVHAGNPTLSPGNLTALAAELRGRYAELLALANSSDGQGGYLFAGFQTTTQPFTQTSGAAVYVGDQGVRKLQISASRQIEITSTGQEVFRPGVPGADPFETLENLITALNSGTVTPADITNALQGIDAALNNVLRVRAAVGARLNELDATQDASEERGLQYRVAISNVEDLDYTKAITELTQRQVNLEAAQKSFLRVTGLSLFNYL